MYHKQGSLILFLSLSITSVIVCVSSRATTRSSAFNLTQVITEKVDCSRKRDIIDECGLQQGYSFRHDHFTYPTDHAALQKDCKRQTEALQCLKSYAKCLSPLTKQVMLAMVKTRTKFNNKLCTEKPSEMSERFIEMNNCLVKAGLNLEKGPKAELNSIMLPESIVASRIENTRERIKYSCCSVAQTKKDFMEATRPQCSQHSRTFGELIDSYLADTVGLICPDFNNPESLRDCEKLTKLKEVKVSSKYFRYIFLKNHNHNELSMTSQSFVSQ